MNYSPTVSRENYPHWQNPKGDKKLLISSVSAM
jgi:hypothetical protein